MAGTSHTPSSEQLAVAAAFYGRDEAELQVAAANLDDGWLPTPEEAATTRDQQNISRLARSAWVASVIDDERLF